MTKQSATTIKTGCGGHGAPALSVEEARARIEAALEPIGGVEKIALRSTLQRVLAEDVRSATNVPSHENSAMDGYAMRGDDLPAQGTVRLGVIGTAWAGRPFVGAVEAGQCARIMTGAPIPRGADTVIMQEQVRLEGEAVHVGADHKRGQNVRAAGEDVAAGQVILTAGKQIMPAELGLLASLGVAELKVRRRLRVAFFSTGDELRSIGEPLAEGEIYDSNRYTLYGMLARLGVEIIDMGVVRDDRESTRDAFIEAADNADVIVTSGGVSVGEADYVKETLDVLGEVDFWQIAIKPGRPLAFGRVQDTCFFGLPGNPVSVMVTFYQFVEPALRQMMGQADTGPMPTFRVPCASRIKKGKGRTEFQRAVLERNADGQLVVRSTGPQGSGLLHSMSVANCFVILPSGSGAVEPGTIVEVQPFHGLI
ncbi:MAG: gephyrin-like molybdotransferase Glp [Acidiferrobacterales bacterium]